MMNQFVLGSPLVSLAVGNYVRTNKQLLPLCSLVKYLDCKNY